jgi:hypothetical protein
VGREAGVGRWGPHGVTFAGGVVGGEEEKEGLRVRKWLPLTIVDKHFESKCLSSHTNQP